MLIGITIIAVGVAVVASLIAWRAVREERRRSVARVAALAREIHGTPDSFDLELRGSSAGGGTAEPMFAAVSPSRTGSRAGLVLAVSGFVAASIAAAAIVLDGAPPTTPIARDASSSGTPPAAADAGSGTPDRPAVPLELLALAHERDGDTLTVRGTVRNPSSGSEMSRLTAVVFLFDRDGGFLSSGRAALDAPALIPGGESTFAVTVPEAGAVARYRVSFRSGDHVVSHVDKRSRS